VVNTAPVESVEARGAAMAHSVRQSGAVEGLARGGLATRGLIYLIIASIAVQIALGSAPASADQNGAIEDVATHPFGKVLLIVLALGFAGYALWRWSVAAAGNPGDQTQSGAKKVGRRLGALATGVAYAGLCVTTIRVLAGGSAGSSTRQQQSTTAWILSLPAGRLVIIAAGVAVVLGGFALIWWGVSLRFERNLATERMGPRMRSLASGLGAVGFSAGGVVLILAGGFLSRAGIADDAAASKGLDQTLRTVAVLPFGRVILAAVAAGLAAYGLYSFVEARYRRV
jgi:hypothetical protein